MGKKRALVTGGAGFIGSHIVDRLLHDGVQVIVLDDFSSGKRENLPSNTGLTVVEGSVQDYASVFPLCENVDWVFHEAAVASVPKTIDDPLGTQKVNYQGTLNVLNAAKENGVKKFVFAASAAAYGDLPGIPKEEQMAVKPLSPYAIDKLASEYAASVYHSLYGLETVCLRYFNVYGPRQDPSSPYSGVISVFVDRISGQAQPTIFGDGEQFRDFVFVEDVVEANMKAVTTSGIGGQIFNIATGKKVTLNELLALVCEIYDVEFKPKYAAVRQGDIRKSLANIDKAKTLLHWEPAMPLREGLKALIQSVT